MHISLRYECLWMHNTELHCISVGHVSAKFKIPSDIQWINCIICWHPAYSFACLQTHQQLASQLEGLLSKKIRRRKSILVPVNTLYYYEQSISSIKFKLNLLYSHTYCAQLTWIQSILVGNGKMTGHIHSFCSSKTALWSKD